MIKRGCLVFVIFILLAGSVLGAKVENNVLEELKEKGEVSVIVILKDEAVKEGLGVAAVGRLEVRKEMIKNVQEKVLNGLKVKKKGEGLGIASEGDYDIELGYKYSVINGFSGKITKKGLEKLEDDLNMEKIIVNKVKHIFLADSVPLINADDVWNLSINGTNITGVGETVCVLDTGVDYTRPALGGCTNESFLNGTCSKVIGGYDFYNEDPDPFDDNGHGTHVSGIIVSENDTYQGVASNAKIIMYKVCDALGNCADDDVLAGLEGCINNATAYNISVISISLGGGQYTSYCDSDPSINSTYATLINDAVGNNIGVIIATGNTGNGYTNATAGIAAPACIENATRITATDKSDHMASYAFRYSFFTDILTAPGSNIISTESSSGSLCGAPGGSFGSCSGTSMATPHVAGVAVLLQQYSRLKNNLTLIPSEIERIFKKTGVFINDSGGSGLIFSRIDVYEAVQRILNINISGKTVYNEHGKIIFSNNANYNYASSCIYLTNNSAYLNASDCSEFNESAQVTLNNLSFGKTPIVLKDGVFCSSCVVVSYTGNNLTFNVTGFSNYTAGANANLSIWDETDDGAEHVGVQVKFYANYTNRTSGQAINTSLGGWCNISFGVSPNGPLNMSFNSSSQVYEYNRSFSADGEFNWNVSCSSNDFENLTLSDTVLVNNTLPVAANVSLVSDDSSNRTGGNLTGGWDYSDGDGDSLQLNETKWYNNSIEVDGLVNLSYVGSGNTTKGENWTFSVRAYDSYNWSSWVNSSVILIRNTLPAAPTLIYPNVSYITNDTINFNWSASSDADGDEINYTLEVSNSSSFGYLVVNYTTNETNNTRVLNETTYYWRVKVCDDEDCGYSSNVSFTIDAGVPVVNITYPVQGGVINNSFFTANFTVNESNLDVCVYNLTNLTGSVSSGSNDSTGYPNYRISFSSLLDGEYNFSVVCNDSAGWSNTSLVGFNVTDSVAPEITAISTSCPSGSTVTCTLTVTTNENSNCRYSVDTNTNYTNMTDMSSTGGLSHSNSIDYTSDTTGDYYVRCNDSNGQVMSSSETEGFNADVDEGDGGGGSSGGGGTTVTTAAVEEEEEEREEAEEIIIEEPSDVLEEEVGEAPAAVKAEVEEEVEGEKESLTGMVVAFFKGIKEWRTENLVLLGVVCLIVVLLAVYFILQKKGIWLD